MDYNNLFQYWNKTQEEFEVEMEDGSRVVVNYSFDDYDFRCVESGVRILASNVKRVVK